MLLALVEDQEQNITDTNTFIPNV